MGWQGNVKQRTQEILFPEKSDRLLHRPIYMYVLYMDHCYTNVWGCVRNLANYSLVFSKMPQELL